MKMQPTILAAGDIVDGDRLRWTTPMGCSREAKVAALVGFPETDEGYAVDFFDELIVHTDGRRTASFQRTVPLRWITYLNRKQIRRSRQDKRIGVESDLSVRVNRIQTELTIGKEPEMVATKRTAAKPPTKPAATKRTAAKPKAVVEAKTAIPQGSRKSLDQMSESHRAHVLKWAEHMENLKAEFVWIAVCRVPGRGVEGLHYVAIKRGSKDYAIVSYSTADPKPITKRNIEAEGFESSTAMMEAFKEYRLLAKEERQGGKSAPAPKAKTAAKPPTKPRAKVVAKPPVRKSVPKRAGKPRTK